MIANEIQYIEALLRELRESNAAASRPPIENLWVRGRTEDREHDEKRRCTPC